MRAGTLIPEIVLACALSAAVAPFKSSFAEPPSACSLKQMASLEATVRNGRLLIPADLDGRHSLLMVDTGGPMGIIAPHLVQELKLQEGPLFEHTATYVSGKDFRNFVMVHRLQLANLAASDVRFVVDVANRPADDFDATFAANFLTPYDVELDLAHGKFNLFSQDHCKGQVVYWSDTAASVPIHLDGNKHTIMPVLVNGKQVQALLDTGTTVSTISAQTANRLFGIDPGPKSDHAGAERPRHRFESVQVGGVEFRNTELELEPEHTVEFSHTGSHVVSTPADPIDLVIGLRHLEKLRVYIAYGEGMIYVTPADAR